jgi:hypothetical protein
VGVCPGHHHRRLLDFSGWQYQTEEADFLISSRGQHRYSECSPLRMQPTHS